MIMKTKNMLVHVLNIEIAYYLSSVLNMSVSRYHYS